MLDKYIGFDIGGTKCAVCIGKIENGELEIVGKKVIPTLYNCPEELIDKLISELEVLTGLKAKYIGDCYKYAGISCGGPLNEQSGIVLCPPNLPKFINFNIVEYIESRLNLKAKLLNDANACALAEHRFGAGKGCKNMVFLTFGTGMGSGLILNNELYSGTNSLAGECGHIRLSDDGPIGFGKNGSFEGYCSGGGIKQLGREKAKQLLSSGRKCSFCKDIDSLDSISAKDIAISAKNGNEDAIDIYKTSGHYLGKALAVLIDILNPERIVIGSIYERSGELLEEEMYKVLKQECIKESLDNCKIVKAKLNENVGDYAAVCAAILASENK